MFKYALFIKILFLMNFDCNITFSIFTVIFSSYIYLMCVYIYMCINIYITLLLFSYENISNTLN